MARSWVFWVKYTNGYYYISSTDFVEAKAEGKDLESTYNQAVQALQEHLKAQLEVGIDSKTLSNRETSKLIPYNPSKAALEKMESIGKDKDLGELTIQEFLDKVVLAYRPNEKSD